MGRLYDSGEPSPNKCVSQNSSTNTSDHVTIIKNFCPTCNAVHLVRTTVQPIMIRSGQVQTGVAVRQNQSSNHPEGHIGTLHDTELVNINNNENLNRSAHPQPTNSNIYNNDSGVITPRIRTHSSNGSEHIDSHGLTNSTDNTSSSQINISGLRTFYPNVFSYNDICDNECEVLTDLEPHLNASIDPSLEDTDSNIIDGPIFDSNGEWKTLSMEMYDKLAKQARKLSFGSTLDSESGELFLSNNGNSYERLSSYSVNRDLPRLVSQHNRLTSTTDFQRIFSIENDNCW